MQFKFSITNNEEAFVILKRFSMAKLLLSFLFIDALDSLMFAILMELPKTITRWRQSQREIRSTVRNKSKTWYLIPAIPNDERRQ